MTPIEASFIKETNRSPEAASRHLSRLQTISKASAHSASEWHSVWLIWRKIANCPLSMRWIFEHASKLGVKPSELARDIGAVFAPEKSREKKAG